MRRHYILCMNRLIGFKEWLSKWAPDGAGEIWDNRSNADLDFGRTGARSKNVAPDNKRRKRHDYLDKAEDPDEPEDQDTTGPAEIDPEMLFLGVPKKRLEKLNNRFNTGD